MGPISDDPQPAGATGLVATSNPPPRLLLQMRDRIRSLHYSYRTEQTYLQWVRRFIRFHDLRHPAQMGAPQIEAFLTDLAVNGRVAASTQNQAKAAILFLYREVLKLDLPWLDDLVQARRGHRLPTVLTAREARILLDNMRGANWLVASLLYGSGLRLLEGLRLRVKDIEFQRREITVREGKGNKDRVTMLPENVVVPLTEHLARVRKVHERDLA